MGTYNKGAIFLVTCAVAGNAAVAAANAQGVASDPINHIPHDPVPMLATGPSSAPSVTLSIRQVVERSVDELPINYLVQQPYSER